MSSGGFEVGLSRHGRELRHRSGPTIDRPRALNLTIAVPLADRRDPTVQAGPQFGFGAVNGDAAIRPAVLKPAGLGMCCVSQRIRK